VKQLIEQLEAGKSDALTAYLRAMANFRTYSLLNQFAIARQHPSAARVAGIVAWNQLGRFVNKGEKGIAILAPVVAKRNPDKAPVTADDPGPTKTVVLGFRRVYLWAEDRTNGQPLPELEKVTGDVGAYLDRLRTFVHEQGITLEYNEGISPALGVAFGTTIQILPEQSRAEEVNTLVHEAAHIALEHQVRRATTNKTVRETEAEAFVVAQAIGINAAQCASYIQLYHGDANVLIESLSAVKRVSALILASIMKDDSASQQGAESSPEIALLICDTDSNSIPIEGSHTPAWHQEDTRCSDSDKNVGEFNECAILIAARTGGAARCGPVLWCGCPSRLRKGPKASCQEPPDDHKYRRFCSETPSS